MLPPGQAHDLVCAQPLIENVAPDALIGDKAYERKLQLTQHSPCKVCLARGLVVPARLRITSSLTVATGPPSALGTLGEPCHKSTKAQIESRGYCDDIGLDGHRINPNHPL